MGNPGATKAQVRRAATRFLPICLLLTASLLAVACPAEAAQQRDPSYSASAQREASRLSAAHGAAAFDRDRLITDVNFTAADCLTQAAIQSFLVTQSGVLDSYRASDHNGVTRSASAIIKQAAEAWQVSPKVILATLQKEQGLLSATAPSASALAWAMGCGVPDTGSSNTTYKGFGKQVWYGAESLHNDGKRWYSGIIKVCGDGTVTPTNASTYALYAYTPWIGVSGGGNKLFWTVYRRYFGDPLAVDSTAPTTTVSGADGLWRNQAASLTFSATDNADGTGVACTQYQLDAGSWTAATTLTIPAAADHSDDGRHAVRYRSRDDAGNVERAKSCTVKIDTVSPSSAASALIIKKASASEGRTLTLEVAVSDAKPSCGKADLVTKITSWSGKTLCSTTTVSVATNATTKVAVKLTSSLAKGIYYVVTRATDVAGNLQAKPGRVKLTVK
jgi:hypothetical protein